MILSGWRIRNPLQYDAEYQKRLCITTTGVQLTPRIAFFDQQYIKPTDKSIVDYLMKIVPEYKTAYDFCTGSGAIAIQLVKKGYSVVALDSVQEHFSPSPGVTFALSLLLDFKGDERDISIFDPPWGGPETLTYTECSLWFQSKPLYTAITHALRHTRRCLYVILPPNHDDIHIDGFTLVPHKIPGALIFVYERMPV